MLNRKIRMGMVGGGPGSMIGPIHRMAARLDGEIDLVCGVFSRNAERSRETAQALQLPAERVYGDYQEMMRTEAALPDEQRMDFVAIVTPNDSHFAIASAALENGFHVFSDKPATRSLAEAEQLAALLQSCDLRYGLTHTYAGYPMVKQARSLVADGALGRIRKVLVEYPQGWLAEAGIEQQSRQAAWRLDPQQAGVSSCVADIGSHAAQLSEYVLGATICELCADLSAVVDGRNLDDDATVLLRFDNGAKGVLIASQICAGEENNLTLRVYGEKGGLEWRQHEPNTLWLKWPDRAAEMQRAGGPGLSALALANCRTPAGHPEGYLEAFANHYRNFAGQIRALQQGRDATAAERDVPGMADALRGMRFIEAAVSASGSEQKWHRLQALPILEALI